MCKVIAIANQKGGVGKTTTCVNLGIGLAREGKRVLLIEADAQGSMAASLGIQEPDELEVTLVTIMEKVINDEDLPVNELADENCALFLWVTFPLLKEIWKVIDAWGFTYKSVAFVWIKQNKKADSLFWGMGYWTRANAEICILATKGSPKRYSKRVHQVIVSHIEEHSKKPEEARRRIEQLMGDVPRIELFARRETPGWDVWGNEVACSLGTEILQENKRKETSEKKMGDLLNL